MRDRGLAPAWLFVLGLWSPVVAAPERAAVEQAAARAVEFAGKLAYRGGYVWWYRTDGAEQAGEGNPTQRTTIWVQPPGTPAVGLALLRLHEVTGDPRYLTAATEAGEALAWGQMASGGWYAYIDFDTPHNPKWVLYYRRDQQNGVKQGKRKNISTCDDDITQSALRFLVSLDQRLDGRHETVRGAAETGLTALLAAQYRNGAWAQVFDGPVPEVPVMRARFPADWRAKPHADEYWKHYTLNDDALKTTIETLLLAARLRGDQHCLEAARRGGQFLLLAQLPAPQPVWAQQYDADMEPAWARRFELPAACTLESVGALEVLLELARATGEQRFLEPVRPALAWFRQVRLPDGRWARFYELRTNRPIYFTAKTYEITYDDGDLPPHYGWKHDVSARLAAIEAALTGDSPAESPAARAARLAPEVARALSELDAQGRWVTSQTTMRGVPLKQPREVVDMAVLVDRLNLLADYLEATRPAG